MHDHLGNFARRTAAAGARRGPVRVLPHQRVRVLNGDREANIEHNRQVDDVITDKGCLHRRKLQLVQEPLIHGELLNAALEDMLDAKIAHAMLDHPRRAAGDDADGHAVALEHLEAVPILGVERLVLLTVIAKDQATVGKCSIHIKQYQPDIAGDGKYGGSGQENLGDGWGAQLGGEISRKLHLHARSLSLTHPVTGKRLTLTAPLPPHMERTWAMMDWNPADAPADPFEELE